MGREEAQRVIKKVVSEGRFNLLEPEAKAICLQYEIPTPDFCVATTSAEAVRHADQLGYPVVLKIVSPDIIHKTDVDGVIVGLPSAAQVESGYLRIMEKVKESRPDARISGMLVQRMAPESTQVIIGCVRDAQFGHTILFGLGGVLVEILKDVAFRIAPLRELDAYEMIREIKGYPVLLGYRGSSPADLDAIVKIILRVSRLVTENPEITQMDLNPMMVYARGASVVDVRMLLSG